MLDRNDDGWIDVPPDWQRYTSGGGCGCLVVLFIVIVGAIILFA